MPTTSSETDRIATRFRPGRTALIPFLPAGYPSRADTPGLLARLADAGADVIELGVPFSDPLADGPTIQRASQQAIEGGATLSWTLETLAGFRARYDTPVVLFSYLNPILHHGPERFLAEAAEAGADGVLITDLPVGGDPELERLFEASPLALIRLVAPTSTPDRAREIAARAQGFLYYISRTGVTGASRELRDALGAEVAALRAASPVPVAVGFGISTPAQAAAVADMADGVVVGSALVDALDRGGPDALEALVRSLRDALR